MAVKATKKTVPVAGKKQKEEKVSHSNELEDLLYELRLPEPANYGC